MYIDYLNFPQVPVHLIHDVTSIINTPIYSLPGSVALFFKTTNVNDDLLEWLKNNIPFEFSHARYQVIYNGITAHKDSTDRVTAINYLLDTGGNEVTTTVYDDHGIVLQSVAIIEKQWHYIATNLTHDVTGRDFNKPRVAISIDSPKESVYFSSFIKY